MEKNTKTTLHLFSLLPELVSDETSIALPMVFVKLGNCSEYCDHAFKVAFDLLYVAHQCRIKSSLEQKLSLMLLLVKNFREKLRNRYHCSRDHVLYTRPYRLADRNSSYCFRNYETCD
ncbi:MAG: hypothetical protein IJ730_05870 [Alphaproteobacteria bacterium]|nr:hypothetical protein [Alphaproteobacteria bacterium]